MAIKAAFSRKLQLISQLKRVQSPLSQEAFATALILRRLSIEGVSALSEPLRLGFYDAESATSVEELKLALMQLEKNIKT